MSKEKFSFRVSGLEAAVDAMAELTLDVQNNIVRKAAGKAMEPVVDEARRRAPVSSGHLAESIGLKRIKMRGRYKKGLITFSVGPRQGFDWAYAGAQSQNKPFKYGVPLEYGHVTKWGTFVPPAAFMRDTYYNQRSAIPDRFTRELKPEIENATERAAKKSERKFKKEIKASEYHYTIAKAMRDRDL